LPAEEAVQALGEFFGELRGDFHAGVEFDTDRATALYHAADTLTWYPLPMRPGGATDLELYDAVLPVAHLIAGVEERALPGIYVGGELNRDGQFDAARHVVEDTLARVPEAREMRAYLLLELAESDRHSGYLSDAWERIEDVKAAVANSGLQAAAQVQYEREIDELIVGLRMSILLALGLPDLYLSRVEELEGMLGPDHPEVIWAHARFCLATDKHAEVARILAPELEREDLELEDWSKMQLTLATAEAELSRMEQRSPERAIELFEALDARPGVTDYHRRGAQLRLVALHIRAGDFPAAEARARGIDRTRLSDTHAPWLTALEARLALARKDPPDELARRLDDLQQSYRESLAVWAATPVRSGGVGFLHYVARRDVISELVRLTLAVEGPEAGAEQAVRELMRARGLGTIARRLRGSDTPATLEEFRRDVLAPGRGALVLLPGTQHSHVFAIDREQVVCAEIAPLIRWSKLRRGLEKELRHPPAAAEREASATRIAGLSEELASFLLPDEIAERVSSWSELYVESAHLTGFLPFELLPLRGEPLGLSLPMAYLPSLNVGCLLQRRGVVPPNPSTLDMALIADPDGATSELDLPWTDGHAAALRGVYGEEQLAIRRGPEASKATLDDPELMNASVLQLVLHGLYEPLRERSRGIAMAPDEDDDGRVWCETVERLELVPRLVVLAVCGASRGPLRSGDDGVTNLGGAFLLAGSTQVVLLSSYDLEFQATMALTDVFHSHLRTGGESPAAAMLAARRAVAADEVWAHPYYHSMMSVVGLGHEVLFAAPPQDNETSAPPPALIVTVSLLSLLAVVLVLLGLRRRRAS
jgi:hypothetical protein